MLGQVATQANNVTSTQAFFQRVTAQGYVPTANEQTVLDEFQRQGVTRAGQASEAAFGKVTEVLGVSAKELRAVMGGCPYAANLQKAQAKAE